MIASLLLAAALVGHNPAFEDRPPIHGQADAIHVHHVYDRRGTYEESLLIAYDTDGYLLWSVCLNGAWVNRPNWPTVIGPGLLQFEGRNYRARELLQVWGPRIPAPGYAEWSWLQFRETTELVPGW